MAKVAQKLDRITATICIREINAQGGDSYPRLTPDDAKNFNMINVSPDGGLTVYGLCKGSYTLLMRAIKTDHPFPSLLDFQWIKW